MAGLVAKPQGTFQWIDNFGKAVQTFLNYHESLDALIRTFFGTPIAGATQLGQVVLVNAANDAAAAAAGVKIGQMYRNGSVLQVRVT
jgi:DNA polymerase III epsilon subunit-like protein